MEFIKSTKKSLIEKLYGEKPDDWSRVESFHYGKYNLNDMDGVLQNDEREENCMFEVEETCILELSGVIDKNENDDVSEVNETQVLLNSYEEKTDKNRPGCDGPSFWEDMRNTAVSSATTFNDFYKSLKKTVMKKLTDLEFGDCLFCNVAHGEEDNFNNIPIIRYDVLSGVKIYYEKVQVPKNNIL